MKEQFHRSLPSADGRGGDARMMAALMLALIAFCGLAPRVMAATAGPDGLQAAPIYVQPMQPPPDAGRLGSESLAPIFLFNTGTPVVNPFGVCGGCYAWSSTFYSNPANYDFTARSFTVTPGSVATAFRSWWAYGNDGPRPNNANRGGSAADFSRISLDLYQNTGGRPGGLVANLDGTWTTLDAGSNYREFRLTTPYTFTGANYFVAIRAETSKTDYQATILWLMCATHDALVDYEDYNTALNGSTGGWRTYTTLGPCPADQDFGLQILSGNVVGPVAPSTCISIDHPCVAVPVDITRSDAVPMRGYSVTFTLTSNLALCSDLTHSITQGSYLSGNTNYQVLDNHDGSYTVDCAILGLPCGATAPSGNLFNLNLTNSGGDGTGMVAVTQVTLRDCNNSPIPGGAGAPVSVTIDNTAPVAVSGLSAVQVKTGNGTNGRTAIHLTFTAPGDAALTEVYRAPYGIDATGAYPEYDDQSGAGAPVASPTYPPGLAWTLTGVTASGQNDTPPARGYWSYVVYVRDACGNWSAASNQTGGTLNYHLGDVSDGDTAGVGDNAVDIADISLLGAHYGITLTYLGPFNYLDVGPTGDYSVNGLPTTDNRVNFEDLMMFAMNYELVSLAGGSSAGEVAAGQKTQERPALGLVADPAAQPGFYTARLYLRDNTTSVKGIHAVIAYDPAKAELLGVTQGRLLSGTNIFFKQVGDIAGLVVDAAALGQGSTIAGSGEVAVLRFRMIGTSAAPVLARADLRDRDNAFLGQAPAGAVPHRTQAAKSTSALAASGPTTLLGARPNPSGGTTEIQFRLAAETQIRLRVFDIGGRLVRTLADRTMPAGTQTVAWDGRDDNGLKTGVGVYLCTFQAGETQTSLKLYRYR